jgi:hypothetical protein
LLRHEIRAHGLDAVWTQLGGWEVAQVRGHDRARAAGHGSGNNVPVIGVGKLNLIYQFLPAFDGGVLERGRHQRQRPVDRRPGPQSFSR